MLEFVYLKHVIWMRHAGVGRFSLTSKLLNPKAKSALVSLSNKLKGTVDPTIPAQKEVWTKWGLI